MPIRAVTVRVCLKKAERSPTNKLKLVPQVSNQRSLHHCGTSFSLFVEYFTQTR